MFVDFHHPEMQFSNVIVIIDEDRNYCKKFSSNMHYFFGIDRLSLFDKHSAYIGFLPVLKRYP